MSGNRLERRSRPELSGDVLKKEQEYTEHGKELGNIEQDRNTERDAIAGLEKCGSIEVIEATGESLDGAVETTESECRAEGEALDSDQEDGKELERNLEEREASSCRDKERIGQAAQGMHGDQSRRCLEKAEVQEQEEIEFLHANDDRAREAREASEAEYERIRQSVFGSGG